MPTAFYQTTWNEIDLLQIKRDFPDSLKNGLPTGEFYKHFYDRLAAKDYQFSDGWHAAKKKNAQWLLKQLETIFPNTDLKSLKILSVGAGLGVVEFELLKAGMNVSLQEWQESSFEWLKKRCSESKMPLPRFYAGSLDSLKFEAEFDLVYLGTVEYALANDSDLVGFHSCIRKILGATVHTGSGKLIAMDHLPSQSLKSKAKQYVKKTFGLSSRGVYWGKLRSSAERAALMNAAGFKIEQVLLTSADYETLAELSNAEGLKIRSIETLDKQNPCARVSFLVCS